MAREKKKLAGPPPPAPWMSTFSDLMNLLLCFFVLLFSMSTRSEERRVGKECQLSGVFVGCVGFI